MLKSLHLQNFTVFANAKFEFGEGLNVLVGTNGTGKTHVLKVGYAMASKIVNLLNYSMIHNAGYKASPYYKSAYSSGENMNIVHNKIKQVFQASPTQGGISDLVRHKADSLSVVGIQAIYPNSNQLFECTIDISEPFPSFTWVNRNDEIKPITPVFIPAKEVVTMDWLLTLYERREIPIDATYSDLLRLLSGPPLRSPEPIHIVEKLASLIGGKVEEESGRFYLDSANGQRLEMNLVAEGMRKFATIYKLLVNGTLTPETTLFWDEPEANLNPALLKDMAVVLSDLAEAGFQIILATHSLFLMRELHILAQQRKKSVRYFGLYHSEEGDVQVETQDDLLQLQHLVALDAELKQTFDFEAALDDEYAGN